VLSKLVFCDVTSSYNSSFNYDGPLLIIGFSAFENNIAKAEIIIGKKTNRRFRIDANESSKPDKALKSIGRNTVNKIPNIKDMVAVILDKRGVKCLDKP
jgi:hypothetical protein